MPSYSFLMLLSFSETYNTLHFMFVYVVMYLVVYNTQVGLHSGSFMKYMFSLYVTCTQKPHYHLGGEDQKVTANSAELLPLTKHY